LSHTHCLLFSFSFQAAVEADSVVTEEAEAADVVDSAAVTVEDEAVVSADEAVVEVRLVAEVVVVERHEAVVRRGVDVEVLVSVERVPEL
jgi:hypothetical protein